MKCFYSLLFLFLVITLSSCSTNNEVSSFLANADSVEIRFANASNDQLSHNTADPTAVKKLVQLVSRNAESKMLDCAAKPGGIILFFEEGQMKQAVMFSDLKAKCRYFITKVNEQTYHSVINDDAMAFLKGIQSP